MQITGMPTPLDPSVSSLRMVADEPHSFPCRRCLRDAESGEALLLLSYDPWTISSPYRQSGPVFVHEEPCTTAVSADLPEQQRRRLLSVRGFDAEGMSTYVAVTPGADLDLVEVLADPRTAFVHLHNAGPGCFAAKVTR